MNLFELKRQCSGGDKRTARGHIFGKRMVRIRADLQHPHTEVHVGLMGKSLAATCIRLSSKPELRVGFSATVE